MRNASELQKSICIAPRSSNVTNVTLSSCAADEEDNDWIECLLSGPRELKSFTFGRRALDIPGTVSPQLLTRLLFSFAHDTLETLTIRGENAQANGIGDLRCFQRLRYVDIDPSILFRHDHSPDCRLTAMLPRSLQHLRLHEDEMYDMNLAICALCTMMDMKLLLPDLSRLDLHLRDAVYEEYDWNLEETLLGDLATQAEVQGVELQVHRSAAPWAEDGPST